MKTSWTATELLRADFPEPRWAIPGLIPEGLTLLAGRPKLGKSWLALQAACAVGTGGKFFGLDVKPGRVLYLALEDSPRRVQTRMKAQYWPASAQVEFEFTWPNLVTSEDGLSALQARVCAGRYALVVMDTLSRAATFQQNNTEDSTVVMAALQSVALEHEAGILCIDHHRKANGFESDSIDDVLGATGKTAVADAILGLYRERGKLDATLKGGGRDLADDIDLALSWDTATCSWQCLGKAGEVIKSRVQGEILEAIREADGQGLTTTALADLLRKDKSNIAKELTELTNKGKLFRGVKVGKEIPYFLSPV